MPAETYQRVSGLLWSSSPSLAKLSPIAGHVFLMACSIALDDGDVIWDGDHSRPIDVIIAAGNLTPEIIWGRLPRTISEEECAAGWTEVVTAGAVQTSAGAYVFPGLGRTNSERFLQRERKKETRQAARAASGKVSPVQRRTGGIAKERVEAFLAFFAQRYQLATGSVYVPDRQADVAVARKLLGALESRDLAGRVERFLHCDDHWIAQVGRSVRQLAANINKPCVIGDHEPRDRARDTRTDRSAASIARAFGAATGHDDPGGSVSQR